MPDHQDPRWISLQPSLINLILTLLTGVLAGASLWLIDIPEWVRAAILLWALIVLVIDVYWVRHQSAGAVGGFYLIEREKVVPSLDQTTPSEKLPTPNKTRELVVRLRYANPEKRKKADGTIESEADGMVLSSPYVSTYFTTIPYRLPGDPPWRRWFPRVLALWADSLDRERFRETRVKLKWR